MVGVLWPLSDVDGPALGISCWDAKEDNVAGDGTAAAESNERGLAREVNGKANVLARAASDGKDGRGDVERGGPVLPAGLSAGWWVSSVDPCATTTAAAEV